MGKTNCNSLANRQPSQRCSQAATGASVWPRSLVFGVVCALSFAASPASAQWIEVDTTRNPIQIPNNGQVQAPAQDPGKNTPIRPGVQVDANGNPITAPNTGTNTGSKSVQAAQPAHPVPQKPWVYFKKPQPVNPQAQNPQVNPQQRALTRPGVPVRHASTGPAPTGAKSADKIQQLKKVDSGFVRQLKLNKPYRFVGVSQLAIEGYLATSRDVYIACRQRAGRIQFRANQVSCTPLRRSSH